MHRTSGENDDGRQLRAAGAGHVFGAVKTTNNPKVGRYQGWVNRAKRSSDGGDNAPHGKSDNESQINE